MLANEPRAGENASRGDLHLAVVVAVSAVRVVQMTRD
jgi:hypothetical protein